MDKVDSIRNLFPREFHTMLKALPDVIGKLQEIRLRVNCPCCFIVDRREYYPDKEGYLREQGQEGVVLGSDEVAAVFNHICQYSPYAYESQLRQGFLTVAGGHRVGVCGQVVMEGESVTLIKQVRFLHIRVVHEVQGAAKKLLPHLYEERRFLNTLLISPPGVGKTTLLRDIARMVSDGNSHHPGMQVCIIDERSEIAGSYMGVPQTRVGVRSDVLDGCPKAVGMMMAIRSMAPQLLVVDELGLAADYEAISCASGCGIRLLASIHGKDMEDIYKKDEEQKHILQKTFDRFVVLQWKRRNREFFQHWTIYDANRNLLVEKQML